ncbi:MAG: CotH kinase family protein, partial [Bacteroidales bacterium]|nr:CotH kinase family protein [Bacteroidales bacterium]
EHTIPGEKPVDESKCGFLELPLIGAGTYAGVQFTSLTTGMDASVNGRSIAIAPEEPIHLNYDDTLYLRIPLLPGLFTQWQLAFDLQGADPVVVYRNGSLNIVRGAVTPASPVRLSQTGALRSFSLLRKDNPELREDVHFAIDHEAATLSATIPYYVCLKAMKASFTFEDGAQVSVGEAVQESGSNVQNFYTHPVFTVSDAYGFSKDYRVSVEHYTGLPVLIIDTPDSQAITSKEKWVEGTHIRIDGVGRFDDYESFTDNIKGRGNATWNKFPKKPYNIKLDDKAPLLGMPANKRWSMLANYRDRSRISNKVAYYIGDHLDGLAWTSHSEYVSVILNGEEIGLYQFTEQVRIGPDRVDIDEFEQDESGAYIDLNEETITGGYLMHVDTYYDEPWHFRTSILNLPVEFKNPNENIPDEMMEYIMGYYNRVESLVVAGNWEEVHKLIDLDSFVDFWLAVAVCGCGDNGRPGSDYMYKKRGGLLYAGPLWDFDGCFHDQKMKISNVIWYPYLFKDPLFCEILKAHWEKYHDFFAGIPSYMDAQKVYIAKAEQADANLWLPFIGFDVIHGEEFGTFRDAVERIKTFWVEHQPRVAAAINSAYDATHATP